jgi:hypothetical protein
MANKVYDEFLSDEVAINNAAYGYVELEFPTIEQPSNKQYCRIPVLDKIEWERSAVISPAVAEQYESIVVSRKKNETTEDNINDDFVIKKFKTSWAYTQVAADGQIFSKDDMVEERHFDYPRPMVDTRSIYVNIHNETDENLTYYVRLHYHVETMSKAAFHANKVPFT